ncbi:DUF5677 domain-containing protein [Pseudomonas graminis]|uniref:Uncharacterized protein n=1 Tax=Pseudomonas graminis TaxID=158627 RepID=A0A1C2EET3_9PSED|nr:DUF5677 domain-containing protein [Pseudomonas graminis]OCX25479.1 hypothetical protein BBI10_01960 [Pseudomonas graminis]
MDHFNRKEHFTNPHMEHVRHLPALEELQRRIEEVLESISLDGAGEFKMATKVCCYAVGEIVADLNRAILQSLKIGSYSAAETLSRTSLENSINFVQFTKDLTANTPKSLFSYYFQRTKDRAEKWKLYAERHNQPEGVEGASGLIESNAYVKSLFVDLNTKGVKGWPNVFDRFKNSGYEFLYHQLFAPASDSTHSFSNDIFNRYLMEAIPGTDKEREDRFEGQAAEKISFAFYLATHAVQLYCVAASYIADRAQDDDAGDKLDIIASILAKMLMEHETLTKKCLDMLAPAKKEAMDRRDNMHKARESGS